MKTSDKENIACAIQDLETALQMVSAIAQRGDLKAHTDNLKKKIEDAIDVLENGY